MQTIRRRLIGTALAALAAFALPNVAGAFEVVEPGKLTVAFTGDMPGSGWQDGKLVGYDGEIMQAIAAELGLTIKPALMEWSGTIASVEAGRVDVMLGTMGWTEKRTKIMTLSEPIHYFKNGIMQPAGTGWHTLDDLKGKTVGTITGFSFVPELEKIEGLILKQYDTSDAAVRDLLAGRIQAVIGDPPVVGYAIKQNPDWKMEFKAFTDNNANFPLLTGLLPVERDRRHRVAVRCANTDVLRRNAGFPGHPPLHRLRPLARDIKHVERDHRCELSPATQNQRPRHRRLASGAQCRRGAGDDPLSAGAGVHRGTFRMLLCGSHRGTGVSAESGPNNGPLGNHRDGLRGKIRFHNQKPSIGIGNRTRRCVGDAGDEMDGRGRH